MQSKLIGKRVYVTDRESIYFGEWGIVDYFDGECYGIRIADGSAEKYSVPIFNRNQFKVPRIKKAGEI